ncbi:hypothetical protein [Streptomyces sp. YPW6]|uniref:hypothetical protein n=1 Tax=Streptomyces sp. YPW6 TaxID=2840373 RepID=UPI003EBE9F93
MTTLKILSEPGLVQVEDQLAYQPPRPQLTRKPQARGDVVKDGLLDGGLLGLGQDLTLAHAPTLRMRQ